MSETVAAAVSWMKADTARLVKIVLALVVLLGAAWMFRYDQKPSEGGVIYVTDRWTGQVHKCSIWTSTEFRCTRTF